MPDVDATRPQDLPGADAVIVGSGPNGLAAAVALSQAGLKTLVIEQAATIGGGLRTAELTLPGFRHDVCSAIHPLALGSPFFRWLALERHGLEWIHSPAPLAHPLDGREAVVIERSVEDTAAGLLGIDAGAYRDLMTPLVQRWDALLEDILAPPHIPRHPFTLGRFAANAARSARGLAQRLFAGPRARALIAGLVAHSAMSLDASPSAAFALVLAAAAHAVGWPLPRGGSQSLADALAAYITTAGGSIITGVNIQSLDDLLPAPACHGRPAHALSLWHGRPAHALSVWHGRLAHALGWHRGHPCSADPGSTIRDTHNGVVRGTRPLVLLDVTPRQVLALAGHRLHPRYRRQLQRYRYGPGVFKIDWALAEPIPWQAADCRRAATVHLGGTFDEIAASENEVLRGQHPQRPFVLLAQQSLFDPTRAPEGKHTGWAYCHVPNGSTTDMTDAIEAQVERFAPGFREVILARHTRTAAALEAYNPNCVGGDINGGAIDWRQLFFRPALRANPYATGLPGVYICSSSTPPGGGVHGMCGYHAARAALKAAQSAISDFASNRK
ncbi:MAG: NAD(P)/FAD-dependent oxidoreductase [Planctomycetaceae bacterium]|nr:NAD(P)/FAD-dependent oxidoreductase [Planctomycetaceae bacterium]